MLPVSIVRIAEVVNKDLGGRCVAVVIALSHTDYEDDAQERNLQCELVEGANLYDFVSNAR